MKEAGKIDLAMGRHDSTVERREQGSLPVRWRGGQAGSTTMAERG